MARYDPPRGYVESPSFQQDYDDLTAKYPDLVQVLGALFWGIAENPLDFGIVPGFQNESIRVAKTSPFLLGDSETVVLRIFFVVPESGPIVIEYLDMEASDPAETGS